MCAIIRKPATSMSSPRAYSMCWREMSASVECVAIRTEVAPAACAASRSSTVPMPGMSSTVTRARVTTRATASIHSGSVWAPNP